MKCISIRRGKPPVSTPWDCGVNPTNEHSIRSFSHSLTPQPQSPLTVISILTNAREVQNREYIVRSKIENCRFVCLFDVGLWLRDEPTITFSEFFAFSYPRRFRGLIRSGCTALQNNTGYDIRDSDFESIYTSSFLPSCFNIDSLQSQFFQSLHTSATFSIFISKSL